MEINNQDTQDKVEDGIEDGVEIDDEIEIDFIRPNRYNYSRRKTIFKYKINCKSLYKTILKSLKDNNISSLYHNSNRELHNSYISIHSKSKYNFLSKLDKDSSEYKEFISVLSNNDIKYICIKVGDYTVLKREYEISKVLKSLSIPIFMTNYYCIMKCKDNLCIDNKTPLLDIKKDTMDEYDRHYWEDYPDELNVPVSILVMPYIQYGEFGLHVWNRERFHIVKNCLKHMVMALLYASYKMNFIHSYFYKSHCKVRDGNILLGKTELKSISYGEFGELEIIDGYIPIINDYHNGGFVDYTLMDNTNTDADADDDDENNYDWMVYLDIHTIIIYFNIRSECTLPLMAISSCLFFIEKLYKFKDLSKGITVVPISKEVCNAICSEIDNLDYDS